MTKATPLFTGSEWDFDLLHRAMVECGIIARDELKLNLYPNQIEIITSEQMLDAYASVGLPVMYKHWSFGKKFSRERDNYQSGRSGLAYEIVLNTKPVVSYLMEENTACTQVLVIAHAAYGHNHVFKNNYMFKQWTDADSIVDYLVFARNYISECEERWGEEAVEQTLNAAHALMVNGIDRYKRPQKLSIVEEKLRQKERTDYLEKTLNDLWRTVPKVATAKSDEIPTTGFLKQPEENILYFLEKNSPQLETWQREILRIVRKLSQYFYPQMQCVTGNHLVNTPDGILRFDELILNDGYIDVNNIDMLTLGNKYTPASHTYKRKTKVMQITTSTGKTFTGTPEHPLMILRNGKKIMSRLEDMTQDDYIITNLNYDIFSKNEPKLNSLALDDKLSCNICGMTADFLGSHIVQSHHLTIDEYKLQFKCEVSNNVAKIKKSANYISIQPNILTPELSELLAYIQCSSNINPNNSVFRFVNKTQIIYRVKFLLLKVFGLDIAIDTDIDSNHMGLDTKSITFSSFTLKEFILLNCPTVMSNKFEIPKLIRMSTKEGISKYIRAIIDWHSVRRHNIGSFELTVPATHRDFIEHIQTILYGFGIVSRISTGHYPTYAGLCEAIGIPLNENETSIILTITLKLIADHKLIFENQIGSITNNVSQIKINSTGKLKHIVPNAAELLKLIRKKLINNRKLYGRNTDLNKNYKFKVDNNILVKQNFISSELIPELRLKDLSVFHINEYVEKINNLHLIDDIPEVDVFFNLIENAENVFYDKISKIENVEEERYVYDVTIPENHLFWMDGVISHNTKVLNEGAASFVHYNIMNRLHDKGLLTDGAMLEFTKLHTSVLMQPDYNDPRFSGLNPYYLGFEIFADLKRMCISPDKEDSELFPDIVGQNWVDIFLDAVANYRDESFIRQFLGPKVVRKMKLFKLSDDKKEETYLIRAIQDQSGFREIRSTLADSYEMDESMPKIEVTDVDIKGDRTLTLTYNRDRGRAISESWKPMLKYVRYLWGHKVKLVSRRGNTIGEVV